MMSYWGGRDADGAARAYVDRDGRRRPLRPLAGTSPTEIEYGDGSPEADDLARAILADYLGAEPGPSLCRAFARRFIEPRDRLRAWVICAEEIAAWLVVVSTLRPETRVEDHGAGARWGGTGS